MGNTTYNLPIAKVYVIEMGKMLSPQGCMVRTRGNKHVLLQGKLLPDTRKESFL